MTSPDATEHLLACPVPVLVLRATRDRLVPASAADTVAAIRPDATVVDIDAPHLLLRTAQLAAWRAIVDAGVER